jgi:hypothetical protein
MSSAWTVLVPLVTRAPDPSDVKAGWLAFGVFLALAAAVVFLAFSFRKQLRKVNFEEKEIPRRGSRDEGDSGDSGDSAVPESRPRENGEARNSPR